jgi:hypothetical protein
LIAVVTVRNCKIVELDSRPSRRGLAEHDPLLCREGVIDVRAVAR